MIKKAIEKCGRPMVISLSPGEAPLEMGPHLQKNANMWRISADFWDEWDKLKHNFDLLDAWSQYIEPGSWPDADMLPIGRISLGNRPHGPERWSQFTRPELHTLLSLWMISRSPLMLGAELMTLPDSILAMITNREAINVNQNSWNNRQIIRNSKMAAWLADEQETNAKFLALFNLSDSVLSAEIDFRSESLDSIISFRDLWLNKDIGVYKDSFTVHLDPHGAVLYRLTGN